MALTTVRLRFGEAAQQAGTNTNLSAVREDGRCLWVAGDETATLERLTLDQNGEQYGGHRTYHLADFVELPGEGSEEADIEGLGRSGHYLWATGSHSLKRKKIKAKHDDDEAMSRLAEIENERNRHIVVRIPVVTTADGLPDLVRDAGGDSAPRTAAVLGGAGARTLTDELAADRHLGPFVTIPSKDNGLDVEGIAVHGERVYLGLRGPVLRGWAVVLEIRPYVNPAEPHRLRLGRIDGELFRKHFLDLDGLGIRDLCPQRNDLLVLAGPTMDLDGPVWVYRWHDAALADDPEVARGTDLSRLLELPYGDGDDHPEGIAISDRSGRGERLLVVYDSPADRRRTPEGIVADIVPLP